MLVIFYALPFKSNNKLTFFSQVYVRPFFHQNWNLFAPAPQSNYRLLAVYNDGKINKRDVFTEILSKHQTNRLAGYGPLLLAFSNGIHYFENNTPLRNSINGPVKNDPYFSMLEHSVKNYLLNTRKTITEEVKIILIVDNADTHEERIYFN